MKLGPVQKEWVEYLRNNPSKQMKSCLGHVNPSNGEIIRACCLGAGLIIARKNQPDKGYDSNGVIRDLDENEIINTAAIENPDLLGLHDGFGFIPKDAVSLAMLNDEGKTWPEIADFIEKHPEEVFSKSV